MKKLIITVMTMGIISLCFIANMHICYSENNGLSIFPKESITFAYSVVNIDSMRSEAQHNGLIFTMRNNHVMYILSNYTKHESENYDNNIYENISSEMIDVIDIYNKLSLAYYMETQKYTNNFNDIGFTSPSNKYYTLMYGSEVNILELYINNNINTCTINDTLQYIVNIDNVKNSGGYWVKDGNYGSWKAKSKNCYDLSTYLNSKK